MIYLEISSKKNTSYGSTENWILDQYLEFGQSCIFFTNTKDELMDVVINFHNKLKNEGENIKITHCDDSAEEPT